MPDRSEDTPPVHVAGDLVMRDKNVNVFVDKRLLFAAVAVLGLIVGLAIVIAGQLRSAKNPAVGLTPAVHRYEVMPDAPLRIAISKFVRRSDAIPQASLDSFNGTLARTITEQSSTMRCMLIA
jgi:hypothetical protein